MKLFLLWNVVKYVGNVKKKKCVETTLYHNGILSMCTKLEHKHGKNDHLVYVFFIYNVHIGIKAG